ncbi:MAG: lysophospholipid acyltransferase family protein [Deltaproteobacteria bacterium]|nr:lysophospholipid acyltransferase family protein [Deltaproteobacteria bacterium]
MHYTMFNTPVIKSLLRGISLVLLKILGWKTSGNLPREIKYVLIVAPHTSNWDLFYGIILAFALKLDARYIAKKELFRGPSSPLMTWSGAIPVDRSSSHHIVDQMVSVLKEHENFVLALAPEGTRHRKDYWKSGFYHIALNAHVPILLAFIDYASKTGGAGPLIYPTGDLEQDMSVIRNFYLTIKGRHPENTSPVMIRLKK